MKIPTYAKPVGMLLSFPNLYTICQNDNPKSEKHIFKQIGALTNNPKGECEYFSGKKYLVTGAVINIKFTAIKAIQVTTAKSF
ncbi:hypothetical protein [Chryseobacterium wanjuense]